MQHRRLGRTGLDVSVIGLGTWQLGGEYGKHFTQHEVDGLVARAGELGVNLIDTAECYGDHLAERLVGHAIRHHRDDWVVATKFGHRFDPRLAGLPDADPGSVRSDHWSPTSVVTQLEDSLRALGTDHVDIYQAHGGSDEQFSTSGLWEALQAQVSAGKIRYLGVSLDVDQPERARSMTALGADVVQVTYNRLNAEAEAEHTVLPVATEHDLGVLAREPLANGFLTGKYPPGSRITAAGDWRASQDADDLEARLVEVQRIGRSEVPPDVPLPAWAIAWCLRNPAVSSVIPGSKSIEQLEANLAAADLLDGPPAAG